MDEEKEVVLRHRVRAFPITRSKKTGKLKPRLQIPTHMLEYLGIQSDEVIEVTLWSDKTITLKAV